MKEDLATAIVRPIGYTDGSIRAVIDDDDSLQYRAVTSRTSVSRSSTFTSEYEAAKSAPSWPFSLSRGLHNPHILGQTAIVHSLPVEVSFDLLATYSVAYPENMDLDAVDVSWSILTNGDRDKTRRFVDRGVSRIDLALLWDDPVVCAGMTRIPIVLEPEVLGVYWLELRAKSATCRVPLVIRQAGTSPAQAG